MRMQHAPSSISSTRDDETVFTPVTDPYSGNMAIVARVMNGTEPVHGVEVGIFAGDECRGAAAEERISEDATDGYWFITVAGDEPTPLTIKVYEPATGQITVIEQVLDYTDDTTLGTLAEPYIIQLSAPEGVEETMADGQPSNRKVLINGILYILHNGERYDATGKRVSEK